ncbi:MAG: hypothetical protein ACOX7Q_17585 [Kiritimatiellia bacterium]|jgi:hypothetical protein
MNAVGWFPVGRRDIETILDHAGEKNGPSLIAVWCALLSLANAGGSCELTVPVNAIARAAGLTYKPVLSALRCLCDIGLLTIEERYGTDRRNREPSKYTLKASVSPCVKTPQPLGQNSTRVVESRRRLMTEIKSNNISLEINKETREREAADAARALTPDNFQERAQAANCGRLTEQQLEAFVSYWLEQNTRGKCRFQSEKFFELPRRIATWASRERVAPIPSAAPAAVKPERPIWKDCAARCRYWDDEKRWCSKFVKTEPKSCEHCREF